jgi:hypothetical protein
MAQRAVTLADIVRGHVSLEIEGFDRLYFNGWVPALQTSGQIAGWLAWGGAPVRGGEPDPVGGVSARATASWR